MERVAEDDTARGPHLDGVLLGACFQDDGALGVEAPPGRLPRNARACPASRARDPVSAQSWRPGRLPTAGGSPGRLIMLCLESSMRGGRGRGRGACRCCWLEMVTLGVAEWSGAPKGAWGGKGQDGWMDGGWVSGLQQPPALRSLTMWGDFWSLEELRAGAGLM